MRRLWALIKRRPVVSGVTATALAAVGAWLFFGYFGFHTLFFDTTVDEENPFAAGAGASGLEIDATSEEMAAAMNDAMEEEGKSGDDTVDETMMDGDVQVLASGTFIDRAHPTSGTVKIITDGTETFLRLEDFETDNGPDLNVYLATGDPLGSPEDFIDLGDLKGNIGDQNYLIPADVDVGAYTTVYIWCVRFSVGFGAAALA